MDERATDQRATDQRIAGAQGEPARDSRCPAETVNDECARVRCLLPHGHDGLHDDGNGSTWSSRGAA